MKKCFTILFLLITKNLLAQTPVTYYTDFEQPLPPNFPLVIHDTTGNLWQIGRPMKTVFDTAYSGVRALVTDTIRPYTPNNHSYFDIKLDSIYGEFFIDFYHQFNTQPYHAGGYIEVSFDGGKTFQNFQDFVISNSLDSGWFFISYNLYDTSQHLFNQAIGFNGNSAGWQESEIHFMEWVSSPAFFGHYSPIVRFNFISDSSQAVGDGWMIDNLEIFESFVSGISTTPSEKNILAVFPNPVEQNATVYFQQKQQERIDISLYDLSGKKLMTLADENDVPGKQQLIVPMKNFAKGIYILKVETSQGMQSAKIVKQ